MRSDSRLSRLICSLGLILAFATNALEASYERAVLRSAPFSSAADIESPSDTGEEDDESGYFKSYYFGTYIYYSASGPVTLDEHFVHIDEYLERRMYWLFEYGWKELVKQEKLRTLSPEDQEYIALKQEIIDEFHELQRLSNCYYEHGRENISEYVDACRIPRDLAWRFGLLLALFGNYEKELAFCECGPSSANNLEREQEASRKFLDFHKTALLYFSYYLGLSESVPSILQHADLGAIVSSPGYSVELDTFFQKELSSIDEAVWMQAMQKLDQQRLEHICMLFRDFYRHLLQNREALPKSYASLAAGLGTITTKLLLAAQQNASYNLDAVNPWMFRLYMDLKRWEALQRQDAAIAVPDLQVLLPEVQQRCMRLLPLGYTMDDVTEETEFAVCDAVRKRNLLPSNHGNADKGEEIVGEFEFSPVAIRWEFLCLLNFFDTRARYVNGYCVAVNEEGYISQQIYNYLSGYIEIGDVPITKETALDYLLQIKLFDILSEVWNSGYAVDYYYWGGMHFGFRPFGEFYFPRTTYELRKLILRLCPHLNSYEALMYSVNPEKIREEMDQTTPDAWVDESEALRQVCIADLLESAKILSDRMEVSSLKGTIVGTRGISGAGKSTFLRRHILPLLLPEGQYETWQIDALAKGILNPDTIKAALRQMQGDLLNTQVHDEGASAFQQLFNGVADKGAYILDKRQLTPHEIETNLVRPAKNCGSSVWLYDFDISLTSSLLRILARPLHGEDPCPAYEALVDGFLAVRRYRAQVVALASNEDVITKYELYATSEQRLIAHKGTRESCHIESDAAESLCIHDPDLFKECLREPTMEEVDAELSQLIDDSFIDEAIARGDILADQRESLEQWRGMTLKASIQRHVQGSKGAGDELLFETAIVKPFNGEEWLAEFPQLVSFLQCEHRLHARGVDEAGGGLHWEAGQLERGLNPTYNPEARAPGGYQSGIQMKIGYFIVPKKNLDQYVSENLSPSVARELVVHDKNGDYFGLRVFVHPEAYAHFAPLLHAGITFVHPSKSEYMGTPTSSYNSWLIRRVTSSDRMPFIVKMGTPNGLGDIKHLLSGDDIVKCLSRQKRLDKLPDSPDFMLFKETVGLVLQDIAGYPIGTIDSGIIICEIPEPLLTGECKVVSLSALMSCERIRPENHGVAALNGDLAESHKLPLIYELMEAAIHNGIVDSPAGFLKTYFVDAYLQAIEAVVFKEGYSLVGQGHNLYLVLNPDNTIKGFAYRDLQGMELKKRFLESYSWFYRYTCVIKLLNVLMQSECSDLPSVPGAPIRAGAESPSAERSLYHYLYTILSKADDLTPFEALNRLSITQEEGFQLLNQLDESYLVLLRRYFALDEVHILNCDGTVPCAEKGAPAETDLFRLNQILWESRKQADD